MSAVVVMGRTVTPVRAGFPRADSRAIHQGAVEGCPPATAQGASFGLDSVSHPSTAPMDTSPARIVCSNRPDTVGEVLQERKGGGDQRDE